LNNDQTPSYMTRRRLGTLAFFVVLIFLLYQMALLVTPFASALLWAAVLTLALQPLYKHLVHALKGRAGLAAIIMTLATALLVVGPAIALLAMLAAQAADLYQWASGLVQSGQLANAWSRFSNPLLEKILGVPFLADLDVKGVLIKGLGDVSSGMASQLGTVLKNTLILAVDLLIMLISLFFFFRDGAGYYRSMMELLPFATGHKQAIAGKFRDTFNAVINGVFLIALLQGLMTGIGFALFRAPFPVVWGFVAAVLALLPLGGAALVWLPGALYLYLTGTTTAGVLLALWGVVFVTLPDNFLKPLIIGRKAKIPSFFLFLGILGGLQVYGVLGILFGPLVVTLLSALGRIYREEYAEKQD